MFGMINDETGPVTFPEARQGAIAAMEYANNYLGGINGHPIVIDNCIGDGTPAGAGRCAPRGSGGGRGQSVFQHRPWLVREVARIRWASHPAILRNTP